LSKENHNPKALASLLKKLKDKEPFPPRSPVEQLVVSFLNWETSRRQAEQAFERIMQEVVDINELRVSLETEILAALGEDYPLAKQRVLRMREALNEVYRREHDVQMKSVAAKGKKEQRTYLETLPATPPFVVSQVLLVSFGGHAVPVDHKLTALLIREGVLDADTSIEDAEAFLLRNIKADDALDAHLKLQGWADESRLSPTIHDPLASRTDSVTPAARRTTKRTKKTTKLSKKK
jgi:endonuclease III